jgi:hypothetical protein
MTEGTITFWAKPNTPNGLTDASVVQFPPITSQHTRVDATKKANGTIVITLSGPHQQTFKFVQAIPPCTPRGLFVALTWDARQVALYLNGVEVQRIDVGPAEETH